MNLPTASEAMAGDSLLRLDEVAVRYRVPHEPIASFKEYAIRRLQRAVTYHDFWALSGIDLEVRRGEVLGIIGPNGAGKSTLLKVVARVLRPTKGRVRVNGRVAPLELGTGFDFELTGRENVFLNGAMLGFTRRDLAACFDRIVDFAGVREFIDAPLRTYSSGMVARLAFAVATDVPPEILLVDEILSVGDTDFQRKSFERIQDFQRRGTTILMVSHSLEAVQTTCTRAVWLERGQVHAAGSADSVVQQYREAALAGEDARLAEVTVFGAGKRWGSRTVEITKFRLLDGDGEEKRVFETGQPLTLSIEYEAHQAVSAPIFGLAIYRQDGAHITGPNTALAGLTLPTLRGRGKVNYVIPYLPMLEGLYIISAAVRNSDDTEIFDYHDSTYYFRVANGSGATPDRHGLVTLRGEWQHSADGLDS